MSLRDELGRFLPNFNPDDVVGARRDVSVSDILDKYSIGGTNKESSCVNSYDYNLEKQELTITFPGNRPGSNGGAGTWIYHDVPLNIFIEFATGSSLGTYFNLYIRDQYSFERLG